MKVMPYINTAKPRNIVPRSFCFSFLDTILMTTPAKARIGVKNFGLSTDMIEKLLLSMPVRVRIQPVIVVPTLVPRMIGNVSLNMMMLEFTRPTSMTITPEDD